MRRSGGSCTGTRADAPAVRGEVAARTLAGGPTAALGRGQTECQTQGFWGDRSGPRARTQDLDLILMRERMSDELSSNPW